MPRPNPADLGLVLLAAAVLTGAVVVVTQDPAPPTPVAQTARPTATAEPTATPDRTPTPTGTPDADVRGKGPVLLLGADLEPLAEPLREQGWDVLLTDAGDPSVVVVEVEPDQGDEPAELLTDLAGSYPEATLVLVGPFDPEAGATTRAAEEAAIDAGVHFLDPVGLQWTEGTDADEVAAQLATTLTSVLETAD